MPKMCRIPKRRKSSRSINTRHVRKTFLIVCEGAKTEPLYFEGFRENKSISLKVIGTGFNTVSLIEKAIEVRDNEGADKFDQVWCVFDKNSFPDEKFNNALIFAEKNNIKTAYSNEAFELWYLLHFMYCDSALSRNLYADKLSNFLVLHSINNYV